MAFAQKVPLKKGHYWVGRYKDEASSWRSVRDEAGRVRRFAKMRDAERAAEDAESDVRRGQVADPERGTITFREWASEWYAGLDLSLSTMITYRRHLELHLIPFFGETALRDIDEEMVGEFKKKETAAGAAASSLATYLDVLWPCLADAVPRHIDRVPRENKPRRGRRSGVADQPGRKWRDKGPETPVLGAFGMLLLAERIAILTGRDDEFVMITTKFWCGMRLGEVRGLEPQYVRGGELRVEWQLHQIDAGGDEEVAALAPGGFFRGPPKDDSYRTIGLAPFVAELLARHMAARPPAQCECHDRRYVFTGWAERRQVGTVLVREVAEAAGVSLTATRRALTGGGGSAALVDRVTEAAQAVGWELLPEREGPMPHMRGASLGRMLHAAASGWFPAQKGRRSKEYRPQVVALAGPWPGRRLTGRGAAEEAELCWLPLITGERTHLLRHWAKTWMEETGTPEVLSEQVLGHQIPGISGVYRHVSQGMRDDLRERQQAAWEAALDRRLELSPRSPVAELDRLLAARAGKCASDEDPVTRISPGSLRAAP